MSRNPKRKQDAHKHGPKKAWTASDTEPNNATGVIIGTWHVHCFDVIFRYKWVTEVHFMVCSGKLLGEVMECFRPARSA